jgi:hypothetical protein
LNEYTIEYRKQGDSVWTTYAGEFEVNKNQAIYARLKNVLGVTTTAIGNVTNIDKLAPNTPTITAGLVSGTTNKITVTVNSASDATKTDDYDCSGLASEPYNYSKDGGSTWTGWTSATSYTWEGLTEGTPYTIKVKTKDAVGNECTTPASASVTTGSGVAKVGNTIYTTLQNAINAVSTNGTQTTVTLLKNTTESVTIASGQNIDLKLQTYTLTGTTSGNAITNNGTLSISEGNVSTTSKCAVYNKGKVIVNGGTISSSAEKALLCVDGSCTTITGGLITAGVSDSIYIEGSGAVLNISESARIEATGSKAVISVASGANVNISGGELSAKSAWGIFNEQGNVTVTGGKIVSSSGNTLYSTGTLTVGGTAEVEGNSSKEPTLKNYQGTVSITGGTISNNGGGYAVYNISGTVSVTGGTISGNTYGY